MKRYLRIISLLAAVLGLLFVENGVALAAITGVPTISSATVNTSVNDSAIKVSWTGVSSDIGGTVTYDYVLDNTASHTHASFSSALSSGLASGSSLVGQRDGFGDVSFSSLSDGTYYFHLRAYDSAGFPSGTAVISFGSFILVSKPTLSSPPISPAKGDHSGTVTVTILGSNFMTDSITAMLVNGVRSGGSNPVSSLPDNISLTRMPVDSDAANQVTFTVPKGAIPGTYDLQVTNGAPNKQSATSLKAYEVQNKAPVATAAASVSTGKLSSGTFSFNLTGSATDADGDTLTDNSYSWTLSSVPTGVTATSSGWSTGVAKTGAEQSVVVNAAGKYTFTLLVDDGYDYSAAATTEVTVGVESGNNRPLAVATASEGVATPVTPGTAVTLTGEISDLLDGDTATQYAWMLSSVPTGSALAIDSLPTDVDTTSPATSSAITQSNTSQPTASFTPDVVGTYTIALYIKDSNSAGALWSDGSGANSKLTITANHKPVAIIDDGSGSRKVGQGVEFSLVASHTDQDSDELATVADGGYTWRKVSGPDVTLSSLSEQTLTVTATEIDTYVFGLVVKDKPGSSSDEVTVTIEVSAPPAQPSAGSVDLVEMVTGVEVPLAGTTTDSSSGLTYAWTISTVPTGSSSASLVNASGTASTGTGALTGTFKPDVTGDYVLSLTVSNSVGVASVASTVNVIVNTRPVANAGSAQTASKGATVTLNGGASSDVDGNPLTTYTWVSTSRPEGVAEADVTITQTSTSEPEATFTPVTAGEYIFTLTVSDGIHASTNTDTNTVTVTVSASVAGDVSPVATPDGKVDVNDAVEVLRMVLGIRTDQPKGADVSPYGNPDGKVDVNDAVVILQYVLGIVGEITVDGNSITTGTIQSIVQSRLVSEPQVWSSQVPLSGGVSGWVLTADGEGYHAALVVVYDAAGNQLAATVTDNLGAFLIEGLPDGLHQIRVFATLDLSSQSVFAEKGDVLVDGSIIDVGTLTLTTE